jgi:ribosome-interacting GTPase 1
MMPFEDIQIQLIDTPPLAPEIYEPWQMAMIEQADISLLLFDVNDVALLDHSEYVLGLFEERGFDLPARQAEGRCLVLGNKVDLPGGRENFEAWLEFFGDRLSPKPFSVHSDGDLMQLKRDLFQQLRIVRVYTKPPAAKLDPDQAPFVLKAGSTVLDAASMVHKDLAASFRFARIWGQGLYEGQMVERDHVLHDKDVIEIHAG